MATNNADIYTAQRLAGGYASSQVDASVGSNGDFNSRIDDSKRTEAALEWMDAVYVTTGTEADTETINLGYLPIGATVYPEHSFLFNETDPGTTLPLDIGDSSDADRYADGIAAAAAGIVQFTSGTLPAGVTTRHEVTATTRLLIATVAGATSTLTASVRMHFKIAYKALQP